MPTLEQLSPDVISRILYYLPTSVSVLSLWKSGSPLMQKKLAMSVHSISLSDENWWPRSRWPKCLSSFTKLRSLTIRLYAAYLMPSTTRLLEEILKLPATLEHLELHSKDSVFIIAEAERTPDLTDGHEPKTELLEKVTARFLSLYSFGFTLNGTHQFLPAPLFSHMEFKIRKLSNLYWSMRTIDEATLAAFPRTLEHFDGTLEFWDLNDKDDRYFSQIPPNLTRIKLLRGINKFRIMNLCPKRVSIDLLIINGEWNWSKSPRTMPPNIDALELSSVDSDEFEEHGLDWLLELTKLFPNIKLLRFREYFAHLTIRLIHLPSSLTEVQGSFRPVMREGDTPQLIQAKLPNLKTLNVITHSFRMKSEALRALPPYLKALKVYMKADQPVDFLPPNLTDLTIFQLNSYHIQCPLPETLLKITLGTAGRSAAFPLEKFSLLPSSATYLAVEWHRNRADYPLEAPLLPHQLVTLEVDLWNQSWFKSLPRTLTTLQSRDVAGFDPNIPDNFEDLPPNLTRLVLREYEGDTSKTIVFSGSSFSTLSKLTTIRIGFWKFDRRVLQTLAKFKRHYVFMKLSPLEISDVRLLDPDTHWNLGPHRITALPEVYKLWPRGSYHDFQVKANDPAWVAFLAEQNAQLHLYPDLQTLAKYS